MSGAAPAGPLGILAGRGDLPRRLAEARAAAGAPYRVIALGDYAGGWIAGHPHDRAALTAPGAVLAALRAHGCRDVVLAGGVERPSLDPRRWDAKGALWLARLAPVLGAGDDALLRAVRALLEAEGLRVHAPDTVLDLRAAAGVLGAVSPGSADEADVRRGEAILAALALHDVGQCCVVAGGLVLGIETVQGTDAMLAHVGATRALAQGASGGVLVKRAKAGQDPALDGPAIGPATARAAAAAGLRGIAIQAGAVQVLEPDATCAAVDAAGLFLWARP